MKTEKNENEGQGRNKPPLFSSWNRLYAFVLLNLVVLIILFYLITEAFD